MIFVVAILGGLCALALAVVFILIADCFVSGDFRRDRQMYKAQKREFKELTRKGWENRPHWTTQAKPYDQEDEAA